MGAPLHMFLDEVHVRRPGDPRNGETATVLDEAHDTAPDGGGTLVLVRFADGTKAVMPEAQCDPHRRVNWARNNTPPRENPRT